jgi:hypothetical protein
MLSGFRVSMGISWFVPPTRADRDAVAKTTPRRHFRGDELAHVQLGLTHYATKPGELRHWRRERWQEN